MNGYNFTDGVRHTLARARAEASALGHDRVHPAHILLAMTDDASDILPMLVSQDVVPATLRETLLTEVLPPAGRATPGPELPYTGPAKQSLERAMMTAREWRQDWVGSEHLLAGLLAADRDMARAFRMQGVDPAHLVETLAAGAGAAGGTSAGGVRSSMPSRREDRAAKSQPVYRAVAVDRSTRAIAVTALLVAVVALFVALLRG